MENIKYCDCFILNSLQDNLNLKSDSKTEIKTSEYLTDYLPGKFFFDSPTLYLVTQGYFFSVSSIFKDQKTNLVKHHSINTSVFAFLVNSGKLFLLYPDQINTFLLNTQDPLQKILSSSKLTSIALVNGQVFVSAENKIKTIMNGILLKEKYETEGNIIEIKSGFINTNAMLVILENSFEIVNVNGEDENIELVFKFDCYARFQVDFFNKNLLVFSDLYTNSIQFIDWSQSYDSVYSIDIQDLNAFEMKVKKNILLLVQKEEGSLLFFFFNKVTNQFLSIKGFIEIDFESLDFDYEKPDFNQACKLENSFVLNFFLSVNNSIHRFCLGVDLSLNLMFNYLFCNKPKSITLDNREFGDKNNVVVGKSPMFTDRLRMVEDVPKFEYPEAYMMIGAPKRNMMIGAPVSGRYSEDYIDKIHSFFTNENLKSLFNSSFSAAKINNPQPFVQSEPFINLGLLEKINSTIEEMQRFISR